jgi:SAM-dependent methyltransferase
MSELDQIKDRQRQMWTVGDFPEIATRIESASESVVDAVGAAPGLALLDVATGTGNAAMIAASRGATVSGLDLTPKLLEVAAERAKAAGVEIDLVEGDAENLPYGDDSFDRVVSVFGVMFAPHQEQGAAELVRVCRPGGRIGVCAWTPEGMTGQMFGLLSKYLPPPPEGFQPPVLWGVEDHVRLLFEDAGGTIGFERRHVRMEADSLDDWMDEQEEKLGPVVMAKAAVGPERWPEARAELMAMTSGANLADDGSVATEAEYLLSVVDLD